MFIGNQDGIFDCLVIIQFDIFSILDCFVLLYLFHWSVLLYDLFLRLWWYTTSGDVNIVCTAIVFIACTDIVNIGRSALILNDAWRIP